MVNRPMSEIVDGQKLLTLPPNASVQEACKHMHARRLGAVVVTDENRRLLGIFTGRDAVRCLAASLDPTTTELQSTMTVDPHFLGPEARAIEALRLMRDAGFRHIPVVRDGIVIGIASREDFRGLERDRLEEEIALWERI
jgi:CBS domain-containing protein